MNTYEMAAREKKAHKMANAVLAAGYTAAESREFLSKASDEQWNSFAANVDVSAPSQKTRERVLEILSDKIARPEP